MSARNPGRRGGDGDARADVRSLAYRLVSVDIASHPSERAHQLGPPLGTSGEEARRLREGGTQHGGGRSGIARQNEGVRQPATAGGGRRPGRRGRAQRDADDRHRHRDRALPHGTNSAASAAAFDILPNPCRRGSEPSERRGVVRSDVTSVSTAKNDHAGDRRSPSPAVACEPRDGAAEHHAGIAERHDRRKRSPRHAPFAHERRDRDTKQLIVDAVEDDRERGQADDPLLITAPAAGIDDLTNIHG